MIALIITTVAERPVTLCALLLPTSCMHRLPAAIQPIKTVFTYQPLWGRHSVFKTDARRESND